MVKKRDKAAEAPQSWGSPAPEGALPPGGGNISDNPEDRQPPLDEGWNETVQRELGADQPTDPAPAEEPKPKKGKGKGKDKPAADVPTASGNNVTKNHNSESGRLVSIVERIERLAEEKKTIADDMKEVFAEAKAAGYDTATIRKLLQRRRMGKDAVDEMDAILDLYEQQVGFN